ncbi:MAG: pyrimidine 5'-nucleotidase [Alphaproteobacteria bacterium]
MSEPSIVVGTPDGRRPDLSHVDTWVFDLDNTLYNPAVCDLFKHMDRRMNQFIAEYLKLDEVQAAHVRQTYFKSYGTTLRGLMEVYDVPPGVFLDYVHELDLSEMAHDPALDRAIDRLPGRKLIFTNATERHACNVLERLGIAHHFEGIFDVAAAGYVPKPQQEAYDLFLRRHAIAPASAVFFEDTARNLAPAAALGMTTVWIRTDRAHGQMAAGDDFVHHVVDGLADWLHALEFAVSAVADRT